MKMPTLQRTGMISSLMLIALIVFGATQVNATKAPIGVTKSVSPTPTAYHVSITNNTNTAWGNTTYHFPTLSPVTINITGPGYYYYGTYGEKPIAITVNGQFLQMSLLPAQFYTPDNEPHIMYTSNLTAEYLEYVMGCGNCAN